MTQRSSNVLDDWNNWVNSMYKNRGVLLRGVDSDFEQFARETGHAGKSLDMLRKHLLTGSRRKQAWMGWGPTQTFVKHKVAGWDWDTHLNGYITNAAKKFACECGEQFHIPSYHNCKCGKIWNSYVIGTGGDNHQASVEKFICREIPVRENVIVANTRRVAMPRAKNSDEFNHYNMGWSAANRSTNLDRVESNYLAKHGPKHQDRFIAGYTDSASGYPHRFRNPDDWLEYKREEGKSLQPNLNWDAATLDPVTHEIVFPDEGRLAAKDPRAVHYDRGYKRSWHPKRGEAGDEEDAYGERHGKEAQDAFSEGYTDAAIDFPHRYKDPEAWAQSVKEDGNYAQRQGKVQRHNVTDPGDTEEGEELDEPTIKAQPKDWHHRSRDGRWV